MRATLTRAEVRELDRRAVEEFGVPGVVLMENAGRGTAELLMSLGVKGRVVVCCGKGNNGGDGFVIARHLELRGVEVRVLLFAPPAELAGDARTNFEIVRRAGLPLKVFVDSAVGADAVRGELAGAEWVVDALLGTGLTGPPRPPYPAVIDQINDGKAKVLAVDLPSGLDCDTGDPLGATVRADHTATFVAFKAGFLAPVTYHWIGQVHVVDIGAPRTLLAEMVRGET